jgi:hypothetical protein
VGKKKRKMKRIYLGCFKMEGHNFLIYPLVRNAFQIARTMDKEKNQNKTKR